MGSITALGIKDEVLDLETQLRYHLQGNHYPPVPVEMIPTCIAAIDAAYDEDYDRLIDMPMIGNFQVTWRGQAKSPAHAIIEGHNLQWFIDPADEDNE